MIEKLASQEIINHNNHNHNHNHHANDLDAMFKELEQLISKRAERKISFKHHKKHKKGLHINNHHHGKQISKQLSKGVTHGRTPHHIAAEKDHIKEHINGLAVKPRGGSPGPRFMTTLKPSISKTTKSGIRNLTPELEFGFKPIITTSKPISTTASPLSRFRFNR